jgi:hypothetical protein
MPLIYIAYWHFGQRFKDNLDRREDHEHFLACLLQTIEIQKNPGTYH